MAMSDEKTGGYAFPAIRESNTPGGTRYVFNEGMTMLDHFAGLAMQGLVSHNGMEFCWDEYAAEAYAIASAMIAERNRLMTERP